MHQTRYIYTILNVNLYHSIYQEAELHTSILYTKQLNYNMLQIYIKTQTSFLHRIYLYQKKEKFYNE
jgi:hypothetical protein